MTDTQTLAYVLRKLLDNLHGRAVARADMTDAADIQDMIDVLEVRHIVLDSKHGSVTVDADNRTFYVATGDDDEDPEIAE